MIVSARVHFLKPLNTHQSVAPSASLIVLAKAVSARAEVELLMVLVVVDQTVYWLGVAPRRRLCIAARSAPITAHYFFFFTKAPMTRGHHRHYTISAKQFNQFEFFRQTRFCLDKAKSATERFFGQALGQRRWAPRASLDRSE